MADSVLEKMVRRKRLTLSIWGAFEHYIPALFLFIPGCFAIYSVVEIYITHTYDGKRSASELILATSPFLILSVIMFIYQKRQLRLIELKLETTQTQFDDILKMISEKLSLTVIGRKDNIIQFERNSQSSEHAAPVVTIFRMNNCIYFNSMYPPGSRQLFRSPKVNRQLEKLIADSIILQSKRFIEN